MSVATDAGYSRLCAWCGSSVQPVARVTYCTIECGLRGLISGQREAAGEPSHACCGWFTADGHEDGCRDDPEYEPSDAEMNDGYEPGEADARHRQQWEEKHGRRI